MEDDHFELGKDIDDMAMRTNTKPLAERIKRFVRRVTGIEKTQQQVSAIRERGPNRPLEP